MTDDPCGRCGPGEPGGPPPQEGARRRALRLEYLTVGYNAGEGVVSVLAGLAASSVALIGFGVDSAIESLSGGVLIWRLLKHGRVSPEREAAVEAAAVRLVAVSLFVLAAYVAWQAAGKIYAHAATEPTLVGMAIAAASLVVMPLVARAKARAARRMGSAALMADSRQTAICAYLSAALLAGLGANYLFGIWWADPAAALVIVAVIVSEGLEAWSGGRCC